MITVIKTCLYSCVYYYKWEMKKSALSRTKQDFHFTFTSWGNFSSFCPSLGMGIQLNFEPNDHTTVSQDTKNENEMPSLSHLKFLNQIHWPFKKTNIKHWNYFHLWHGSPLLQRWKPPKKGANKYSSSSTNNVCSLVRCCLLKFPFEIAAVSVWRLALTV